MMWLEPPTVDPSAALLAACQGDALLADILYRRGLRDPQQVIAFLNPDYYTPAPPENLPDLVLAAQLLQQAIYAHHSILIWGDFDVDGQTATSLLVDGLRHIGGQVSFYVPHRVRESHGIKVDALREQFVQAVPQVLITCDTGISEFEAIDYARQQGVTVIVTDHHTPEAHLPNAHAVVNPHRLPDDHPLASLPGVGVAYKLMQYLYIQLGYAHHLPALLDLVALGIVADVAHLSADTRYLLQMGLRQLRATSRIGLQALFDVIDIKPAQIKAEDISYQIGPRLNAAGRLGDARLSIELLTTRDRGQAALIAQQLEGLNAERRLLTRQIEQAAEDMLADDPNLSQAPAIILYHPQWHGGLLGVVANFMVERYGRPVLLFAGEGDTIRGSARAPTGYDIYTAIQAQADLLKNFGGHAGAAGLGLLASDLPAFRARLWRMLQTTAATSVGTDMPRMHIDACVPLEMLSLDLAARLSQLGPFGEGNPPIMLATMNVQLVHLAKIGREGQHRKLTIQDEHGNTATLLWWGSSQQPLPNGQFDVAYRLSVNPQRQDLDIIWQGWREREPAPIATATVPINVQDQRNVADPFAQLEKLLAAQPDALVWAEGWPRSRHASFKRRAELIANPTLILFSTPPDSETLQAAIKECQPHTVYVLAVDPPLMQAAEILNVLRKAVENVRVRHAGSAKLDILTGAVAASTTVVLSGLDLLVAQGTLGGYRYARRIVRLLAADDEGAIPRLDHHVADQRYREACAEMAAYRRFFKSLSTAQLQTLS